MDEKNLEILVRYHADIPPLEKIEKGDWVDLRAAESVDMKRGEWRLISLGISMRLPEGYEAHILPRSSTYKNWGLILANHMGVVDESYSGDDDLWYFSALALRDTHVEKGDRICQFRIVKKMPPVTFVKVEHLEGENRGGFGTTGKS